MERRIIEQEIERRGGHFTVDELRGISTQGNPENLNRAFLNSFLDWRGWHGFPTMVLSAYRPGDDGAHGQGLAIDSVLWAEWKREYVDPYQQWLLATTWPFQGVGIYFDWSYKGEKVVGLHTDGLDNNRRPQRWLRITKKVGDEMRQLYYYQSTKNGKFYNKYLHETITLSYALKKYGRIT